MSRLISSFLVATLISFGGACHSAPKGTANVVELARRVVGGDFCENSRIFVNRNLIQSDIFVGTHPLYCGHWIGVYPETEVVSGQLNLSSWDVPIVFYSKTGPGESRAQNVIYVRVVGGPALSVAPSDFENVYLNAMRSGDVLVSAGYAGTRHGSLFPAPNENLAVNQISELLKVLRAKNTDARIVVLAESLGAPLALSAISRVGNKDIPLVLISPMTLSPNSQIVQFSKIDDKQYPLNGMARIKSLSYIRERNDYGSWVSVRAGDALLGFFEKYNRNRSLLDLLLEGKVDKRAIFAIYGAHDEATPDDEMKAISKFLEGNALIIPNQNHRFTSFDRSLLAQELRDIFDLCREKEKR